MHTLYGNPPCKVLFDLERKGLWFFLGYFYDLLRRLVIRRRREVKIISVIRNPIERNVSMFFQDFPYWYIDYRKRNRSVSRFSDASVVKDMYETVFPHSYVDEWFDKEIKRLSGIDVYEHPFDREKGFQEYRNGKYSLLLLEMTKIEDNWPVIESFVGEKLELENENFGEKKWYGPIYKLHKSDLLNDESVNALVMSGKFYQKFYG